MKFLYRGTEREQAYTFESKVLRATWMQAIYIHLVTRTSHQNETFCKSSLPTNLRWQQPRVTRLKSVYFCTQQNKNGSIHQVLTVANERCYQNSVKVRSAHSFVSIVEFREEVRRSFFFGRVLEVPHDVRLLLPNVHRLDELHLTLDDEDVDGAQVGDVLVLKEHGA